MTEHFDSIIIGAGQAGPTLAGRLAGAGQRVALIERNLVGGTCVNTGCTPTKALVASAKVAHMARQAGDFGIATATVSIDFAAIQARAATIAARSRASLLSWLEQLDNCTLIVGHARFIDAHTISVGDRMLTGNRIFINVGGRARIPDLPGISRIPVLTNSSILKLTELPRHLMIVGGSYVALEFAQMFRRFGAAVTVIEQGRHLIGREDVATSDAVRALMESEGIAIRTNATCIGLDGTPTEPVVALDCADGAQTIAGSHVLLATGRVPNTDDLGLDAAGIAVDRHGYVMVNDRLETDVESIWALGDCNGRGAFTHTAYNDYEIVADNLLESADRRISDRIDTYALYVDPPLARVGLSIEQARRAGHRVLVGRRPMSRVSRAVEKGEATGFMEIVVDGHSDAILGATIFGVGGDEAIHCILDLMYARSPASMLRRAVHIHPTVSELLPTIAGELIAAEQ